MASLEKTIQVAIEGEDNLSRKLKSIDRKLDKFGTSLGGVAMAAGKAAAGVAAVSTAITGLVAAGLAQAYQEAGTLEEAMLDLEKVVGDQPEELEKAKQAAIDMSNEYGKSAEDIVSSTASWVQAGYNVADATKIVNDQLDLMVAGDMDAQQATDALTKAMKGFNLEAEESQKVVDVINELSNNYATNSQKLADALGKVAPTANQMNLSLEQMAGLMTPIIEDFQRGREAGNAFEKILLRLKDDAKPVEEAFKAMGLGDFNRQMASGEEIIYKVAENFQDLNKSQKTFVAQQLADKEHSGKFLSVMNDFPTALEATETAMDSAGSATEEADRKMQGINHTLNQIQTAFANVGSTIGYQFKDPTTEALEGVHKILIALEEAIEQGTMDDFFREIRDISKDLADYLNEVADVLPEAMQDVDWNGLADSVRDVGDSFRYWFDGLDLTEPDQLAQAIQKLVDTVSGSLSTFAALNSTLEGTWDALRAVYNIGQTLVSFMGTTWLSSIELISEAYATLDPTGTFDKINRELEQLKKSWAEDIAKNVRETGDAFDDLAKNIQGVPEEKQIDVSQKGAENVQQAMAEFRNYEDVNVDVDDNGTAKETGNKMDEHIPAEKKAEIKAELDEKKMETETEKMVEEIESKIEIMTEKIKAASEVIQSQIEWKAKIDISKIEASAEKVKSVSQMMSEHMQSTQEVLDSLFGAYLKVEDFHKRIDLEWWIDEEMKRRQEAHEKEMELTEAQIQLMEERRRAMASGEGMIKISSEGLEPDLEAFMWKVLERVQVRAVEQQSEFLAGI